MADTHFVIAIRNKVPVLVSGPGCIVTDNSDYTITFEPDAEWDAFPAKTVYYAFDTGGAIVHPIVGNEDAIPVLTKARMVYIGVSAGDLQTTKALGIRVQPSVRQMAGVEVPEPEPDTYDVIMEMLNGLLTGDGKYPVKLYTTIAEVDIDGYLTHNIEMELADGTVLSAKLPNIGLVASDLVQYGTEDPTENTAGMTKQFYVNITTGELWTCLDGGINPYTEWRKISIRVVLTGSTDPTGEEDANVGNLYVNTETGAIFLCIRKESFMPSEPAHPVWQRIGGGNVTSGSGDPVGNENVQVNHIYINVDTGAIFLCIRKESYVPGGAEFPIWQRIGGGDTSGLLPDSGWEPMKYLVTDEEGNVIAADEPPGESLPGEDLGSSGATEVFFAEYGVTSGAEVLEAYTAGKALFVRNGLYLAPLTYTDGEVYFEFVVLYGGVEITYRLVPMFDLWSTKETELAAAGDVPANTSDLHNDTGFITNAVDDLVNYYAKSQTLSKEEIQALVSAIPKFSISVVDALPTTGISGTTIYLVKSGSGDDLYTEYIYANGAWEILGSQRVDLTGYATETWVNTRIAAFVTAEKIVELLGYTPAKQSDVGEMREELGDKLDANALPDAVNDALAQAKASGEFDGEKGDKGDPGEKGDKGDKGDPGSPGYTPVKGTDYFTEADKTELVSAVLAALPAAEGVGF